MQTALENIAPDDDLELVGCKGACRILGGPDSPLNPSTLYRGVKDKRYPAPIKLGNGTSRWLVRELREVKRAAIAARDLSAVHA